MNFREAQCQDYNSENIAGTHIEPPLHKGRRMNHVASGG